MAKKKSNKYVKMAKALRLLKHNELKNIVLTSKLPIFELVSRGIDNLGHVSTSKAAADTFDERTRVTATALHSLSMYNGELATEISPTAHNRASIFGNDQSKRLVIVTSLNHSETVIALDNDGMFL